MAGFEVLYLSEDDVKSTGLTMKECIEMVEEVFTAHGRGQVVVPPKLFLDMRDFGYSCDGDVMPAYVHSCDKCGIKWIGGNRENYKLGLPYLFSILILNDPKTFKPLAVMSGNWLTAMRTGAATAVAAKYLAPDYTKNVCIIGAGIQGKYQLLGLQEVLKINKVEVFDIRKEAQEDYVKEMSEKTCLEIRAAKTVKDAVDEADIVITATTGNNGLIEAGWIRNEGCFLCSIGTFRELGYDIIKSMDKIIVDHIGQAKCTGTLADWFSKKMLSDNDVYAELGYIVAGRKIGRESEAERILCVLTGMGSEDILIANRIYEIATREKNGQLLKCHF